MHIKASYCDISEHEGKEKVLPTSERQEKRENSFHIKKQESEYQWASQQPH